MSNLSKKLIESFDQLSEETLEENRSAAWQSCYDKAVEAGIPENDAEQFVEHIYSRSSVSGLYVPAEVRRKFAELGVELRGNYVAKTGVAELPAEAIKAWYETDYLAISNHENNSNKRAKVDLQQYLLKAREIVTGVMGKEYMSKNDTRPNVTFKDLGTRVLGNCTYNAGSPWSRSGKASHINISNAFKLSEDLVNEYLLNVMVHEFIHSLKSCRHSEHDGEWKRVADLVSANTSCEIGERAQHDESIAFRAALSKLGVE